MRIEGKRSAWGSFPKIVRNGNIGSLKAETEYLAAKGGDAEAALHLVQRLLTDGTIDALANQIGHRDFRVLPVLAVEEAGRNKIPLAIANVLASRMGVGVELGVLQREKVYRTNAGADHRLAFNPTFTGEIEAGKTISL